MLVVQCRKRFHPGRDGVQICAPLPAGILRSYIAIVPFNCIFLLSSLYLFFNNWKDLLHRYFYFILELTHAPKREFTFNHLEKITNYYCLVSVFCPFHLLWIGRTVSQSTVYFDWELEVHTANFKGLCLSAAVQLSPTLQNILWISQISFWKTLTVITWLNFTVVKAADAHNYHSGD